MGILYVYISVHKTQVVQFKFFLAKCQKMNTIAEDGWGWGNKEKKPSAGEFALDKITDTHWAKLGIVGQAQAHAQLYQKLHNFDLLRYFVKKWAFKFANSTFWLF